jgi:hypothetical protein
MSEARLGRQIGRRQALLATAGGFLVAGGLEACGPNENDPANWPEIPVAVNEIAPPLVRKKNAESADIGIIQMFPLLTPNGLVAMIGFWDRSKTSPAGVSSDERRNFLGLQPVTSGIFTPDSKSVVRPLLRKDVSEDIQQSVGEMSQKLYGMGVPKSIDSYTSIQYYDRKKIAGAFTHVAFEGAVRSPKGEILPTSFLRVKVVLPQ